MKEALRTAPAAEAQPAKPQATDLSALLAQLSRLGLDFAAEALPGLLTRAVKEDLGPPALLGQLLTGELERREERRVRTSLKLSGRPAGQTLANFDSRSGRRWSGRSSRRRRPAPGRGRGWGC